MSRDGEAGRFVGAHLQMGTSSNSRCFEIESWSYIQHKDYNLQVMQKVEAESTRRGIPATPAQRLAFYRTYATLPFKTHFLCQQYLDFNRYLWIYVVTVLLKSLPTCYIHLFLSSSASQDHLFLPKMVPILYVFNLLVVVSAFTELASFADVLTRYLDFVFMGIVQKSPWNRCTRNVSSPTMTLECATVDVFQQRVAAGNVTMSSNGFGFHSPDGSYFQLAIAMYNWERAAQLTQMNLVYHSGGLLFAYYILFWLVAAAHHNALYKTWFWVGMNRIHWVFNSILGVVWLHLVWVKLEGGLNALLVAHGKQHQLVRLVRESDFTLVAESISAPPLVHFLAARAKEQASPGGDSALQEFSNAAYFVFRGVLTFQLRAYCESLMRAPLQFTAFNPFPWFYIWPLYLGTFKFGDILTVIFFTILCLTEVTSFITTYQCLVEVMWCEWPRLRRWLLSLGLVGGALLYNAVTFSWNRYVLYVYTKGLTTLVEAAAIVYMYPLGRLVEDITFHTGAYPSSYRAWSIKLVPLYYAVKLYYLFTGFRHLIRGSAYKSLMTQSPHVYWLIAGPIMLGVAFALYNYLYRLRMNWRALFRPVARWGPRDHIQRQLRKQYQSYEYVNSQSSRYLSRYLMAKAEAETYKLDICYERAGRRSTVIHDAFRYDNEKKLV